jgi:fructose transport system substrate-binding protein
MTNGHRAAGSVTAALFLASAGIYAAPASAQDIVGLITKTNTNPFFVKMKEGADQKAQELGMELRSFAGKYDGDNEAQVAAIENLIAAGARGILITPSDTKAVVPAVDQARAAGILVIALDTPLEPIDAADATLATDNFKAGELIGQWAKGQLGEKAADAKIALLDLSPAEVTVDVLRDQGFLKGFGIDIKDPTDIGDEDDPRIVGHDVTEGSEEGGRTAMENLLQKNPEINLVYTINEPAAAGAYEALKAAGKEGDVLIVSVDGGCPGVKNVAAGVIGATSMQFPLKMASMGVEAVKTYTETGAKPEPSPGLDFFNTGVELITDKPVDGLPSKSSAEGLEQCWG